MGIKDVGLVAWGWVGLEGHTLNKLIHRPNMALVVSSSVKKKSRTNIASPFTKSTRRYNMDLNR